jgi:hypothetical protein
VKEFSRHIWYNIVSYPIDLKKRMTNRRYKIGQNRYQTVLWPSSIDEYVSENNPVRAIDAYVETLDLANWLSKTAVQVLRQGNLLIIRAC